MHDDEPATTEERVVVDLGNQRRKPTAEPGPSEAVNLVAFLTEEEQRKIVETVIRDYDADVASRAPRMKRLKEYQGLYASVMKPKTFPWQNAANVNLPILTYPNLQVHGRLYDMLVPGNGKLLYCSPKGKNDTTASNDAELFANWYIRTRMPEMEQGLDDTLHQVCIYGSGFRRTYWNAYEHRVCSDWIPIEDFVVKHTQRSSDPSMRDVPRYTLVQHMDYWEIEAYGADGIYENVDLVKPGEVKQREGSEFQNQIKKIEGSDEGQDTIDEDKDRAVLEQYRKWRMPNRLGKHVAFDGRAHAVIVTVDEASQTLLRMVVREEPDPNDLRRWERQQAAFDMYSQQLQAAQMAPADPMMPPQAPPPIPPGLEMDVLGAPNPPKAQRMREICFFTHYRAFPSEGFYGLGFGDFLAPLNKATNTILNQHIDAATVRNAPPTFISRQMKFQRGTIDIEPGKPIEVDAPMGALKDGIHRLDPPPHDPTSMKLVEWLSGVADKLVASSDLMSGNTSGANRTAKETEILREQMMMQITVLARRIRSAFRHELDKIWRCWGVFLSDEEVFDVIGDDGESIEVRVGRWMFQPDADLVPSADPRTKSQRIEEVMGLIGAITQNQAIAQFLLQQPNAPMLMRQLCEDMLRAFGAERLIKFLPPPPQPPQPPQAQPFWEEDAGTLEGKMSPVHPMDDDDEHLMGHTQFLASPAGASLTKEQREAKENHNRGHHAQKIRKAAQRMQQMQQMLAGPVPPRPMGPPPNMGQMGPNMGPVQ